MARYQIIVLRLTPRQIREAPQDVIRDIREALARARGRPRLNLRTFPADDKLAQGTQGAGAVA